jgi:hypothetical protein
MATLIFQRDLAARNVLLTEGLIAKVSGIGNHSNVLNFADFGLSRVSNSDKGVSTVATFG